MIVDRRRWPVVVAGLALAACGGGGGGHTTPAVTVPQSTTIITFGGVAGAAEAAACRTDARTVQDASDVYVATHGAPAASIDALVADGHLKEAPSSAHGYVIRYDPQSGHVSAQGACTVP